MAQRERIQKLLEQYEKALGTLEEALSIKIVSVLERDGIIQRFEYTYELLWKLIQQIAKIQDISVVSPRTAFKAAFKMGIIDEENEQLFLDIVEKRNRTTHTYNENVAIEIYEFIRDIAFKSFKDITGKTYQYIQTEL